MTARLISPSPHSVLSLSFYIVSDDAMAYFHTDNRDDDKSKDDDDDDDFNILLYILFCILFRVLLALKLNILKSHPYIYFHLFYSILFYSPTPPPGQSFRFKSPTLRRTSS